MKPSKRLLLEALLLTAEDRVWTRTELARASGLHDKARMDLHLDPLVRGGLLVRAGTEFRVADDDVASTLRALLRELGAPAPDQR